MAGRPSRTSELASIIAANSAKLDEYLSSQALPPLSFTASAPLRLPDSEEFVTAQRATLEAITELESLVLGPLGILQKSSAHNSLLSLQAIYHYKIAQSLTTDNTSYADLSKACRLDESNLKRVLRHAMTNFIFNEPQKGFVSHTGASKLLAGNALMRELIGMICEELWPAATRVCVVWICVLTYRINRRLTPNTDSRCHGDLAASQEPTHTGFFLAKDTKDPIYTELAKPPARAKRFVDSMSMFNAGKGNEPEHLLDNYPFDSLGKGVIVEVGGSHGNVSLAIIKRFPNLSCVVQDLPETIADTPFKKAPDLALEPRITFMAHDFFTEQPVKGADVYYFRWIFHNWSDKYAIKILKALIPALKQGARILINEHCLPEPNALPTYQERSVRSFNVTMLEIQNSKEREHGDWAPLLHAADPRFIFLAAKKPPMSNLSIIEAIWDPEPDFEL